MKLTIRSVIYIFFSFFLLGCEPSSTTQSEEKYSVLDTPMQADQIPQVMKVLSLSCGGCREMTKVLAQIESLTNTKIEKEHVTFNESAAFSALIYYTAATQLEHSVSPKFLETLFQFVQQDQGETAEENKLALIKLFKKHNLVSPYDLNQEQKEELFIALDRANQITEESQVVSVPTFIVKGKYVINTKAHNSVEELSETINYLINKKA